MAKEAVARYDEEYEVTETERVRTVVTEAYTYPDFTSLRKMETKRGKKELAYREWRWSGRLAAGSVEGARGQSITPQDLKDALG